MGILDSAELLLQAKNYGGSGDWLDEANSHDAQLGSTGGADTNDPVFLDYSTGSQQFLYLPGVNGNYASTPDSAALSITGDIDIRVAVSVPDVTPPAEITLLAKDGGATTVSYVLWMNDVTGVIILSWSVAGTTVIHAISTAGIGSVISDGGDIAIRATLDVDNGAAGKTVTFYTKAGITISDLESDSGWTQLGSVVTTGGTTSIFDGTQAVELGSQNVGTVSPWIGNYYGAVIKDGIAGTTELKVDFNDAAVVEPFASFAELSSNAATVTINRTATGRKAIVVDQNVFLLGTDDYLEIPDHADLDFALADDLTVMVMGRSYDVSPAADSALVAKKTAIGVGTGYVLYLESANVFGKLMMGTATESAEDTSPALTAGELFTLAGVRNVTDDDIEAFANGVGSGSPTTDNSTGTAANAEVLRIGRLSGAGTAYFDGEIMAVVIWRSALSDADVASAATELQSISCAVTGTAVASGVLESEIVAGGETLILTLTNDTWVATVGDANAITTALIAGLDSDSAEVGGWDAQVKAVLSDTEVVRTSDTVVTITLPGPLNDYGITADETITVTIPATALTAGLPLTAAPTFDITNETPTAALTGTAVVGGVTEAEIITGGETIIITLTNAFWDSSVGSDNAITDALIAGIDSDGVEATGWDAEVKANIDFNDVAATTDQIVTITLPASASYSISADETITVTIPDSAIHHQDGMVATPTFDITNEAPVASDTLFGVLIRYYYDK